MRSLITAGACALGLATVLLAGCGGGSSHPASQSITGDRFLFRAPFGWHVQRRNTEVQASPKPGSTELVSVAVFPLLRAYDPKLFPAVSRELDAAAAQVARRLGGHVTKRATTSVNGSRVRQYVLLAPRGQGSVAEQITYFLRRKTEYELLCQWDGSTAEPDFCTQLMRSFRTT